MSEIDFGAVIRDALARNSAPSNYTVDCFVTSELGYSDVISACLPAPDRLDTGAYVGVGPCQNLTYVGALHPRVAIICDSRPDNLLEHLIFKLLVERAADPLDYLLSLFSRTSIERPAAEDLRTPQDLVDAFDAAVVDPTLYGKNLAMLQTEVVQRWGLRAEHVDRLEYLYGEFFARQLEILDVRPDSSVAAESPTLREVILARTATGHNFHFLTDPSRFRYVGRLHRLDRIIPVVGNLCEPHSVALVNDLLTRCGERADTIYLSNIEDHVLSRYLMWPDGSVTEPNPQARIIGEPAQAYGRLVESLAALRSNPDAMLIRFYFPGICRGQRVGVDPLLSPAVCRLETFFRSWRAGPETLFDTYL